MEYPIGMYIFFGLINYILTLLFSFGQGSAARHSASSSTSRGGVKASRQQQVVFHWSESAAQHAFCMHVPATQYNTK